MKAQVMNLSFSCMRALAEVFFKPTIADHTMSWSVLLNDFANAFKVDASVGVVTVLVVPAVADVCLVIIAVIVVIDVVVIASLILIVINLFRFLIRVF